jgi:hypothetical protein
MMSILKHILVFIFALKLILCCLSDFKTITTIKPTPWTSKRVSTTAANPINTIQPLGKSKH